MNICSYSSLKFYSTNNLTESEINKKRFNIKLNPCFITGYWDGDGSFYIVLRKDKSCKFGYSIGIECKLVA